MNLINLTLKLQVHALFIRCTPMEPWLSIATLLSGKVLTCAVYGLAAETNSQNQTKGLERQMQTNKNKQIIPQFHLFFAQATPDKVSPS
jgi:hypothetical protein